MIFDNSRQFDTNKVKNYLKDYGYQAHFSTVAYP